MLMKRAFLPTVVSAAIMLPMMWVPSLAQTDVRPAETRPPSVQNAPRAVTPESTARGAPTGAKPDATVRDVLPEDGRPDSAQSLPRSVSPQSPAR